MKRTLEQAKTFFKYKDRSKNDAYYTKDEDAKWCVDWAVSRSKPKIGWIEPFAGNGSFLRAFNDEISAYDIDPQGENIIKANSFNISWENRSAITNIPFNLKKSVLKKHYKKQNSFGQSARLVYYL